MENTLKRIPTQTFVFLDIESTAVLAMDKPKMTEICLTAVHRDELLNVFIDSRQPPYVRIPKLPRVTDSLSLCLNPGKPVLPVACELSGLDNINLNGSCKRQFGELDAILLSLFLSRQEGPICLIAHNGIGFDFPLLKAELDRINFNFCFDIFCGDTLQAFRNLDDLGGNFKVKEPPSMKRSACSNQDQLGTSKKRRVTRSSTVARSLFPESLDDSGNKCSEHDSDSSETNVKEKSTADVNQVESQKEIQGFDSTRSNLSPSGNHGGAYFRNHVDCRLDVSSKPATPSPGKTRRGKYSYKLVDVYQHIFGVAPSEAHQAAADVNTLIAIFAAHADSLIEYFDSEENSLKFGSIPQLYGKDKKNRPKTGPMSTPLRL